MIAPAHFFTGNEVHLGWTHAVPEVVSWEVFRGRLLDPAHTRERADFTVWNVHLCGPEGASAEPVLSLKLEEEKGRLHVVRGLECYAWEGYDAGGSVYLSRERRKWVRELVATLDLAQYADTAELRDELACQLFRAVVGGSRLPLTSVEAPLPAFSFGQLLYCYRPGAGGTRPLRGWQELLTCLSVPGMQASERAHLLQTFLLAVPAESWPQAAAAFAASWAALGEGAESLTGLLRTLFNEVSLTPWTDLAARTLTFLARLHEQGVLGPAESVDFLGQLLCQLGRHLTAYDLVTFHHRGANYPDALLLDAVLKEYLAWCEHCPQLFRDDGTQDVRPRLRRRALRQGWLQRRRSENHPVPDLPTSPGENARVLPTTHPRVPEEQILQPARRSRRLFAGDPLPPHLGQETAALLRASCRDIEHAAERRELGLALFLERPLGTGKAPGEPDQTPLLASAAFSRSIANSRLKLLEQDLSPPPDAAEVERLQGLLSVNGIEVEALGSAVRPGAVSLADAHLASSDFVFLHTLPGGLAALTGLFDFQALAEVVDLGFLLGERRALVAARTGSPPRLCVYDGDGQKRLEMEVLLEEGYVCRAGQEWPRAGLRAVRVWQRTEGGWQEQAVDVRVAPVRVW
jgi:hypothetical protein